MFGLPKDALSRVIEPCQCGMQVPGLLQQSPAEEVIRPFVRLEGRPAPISSCRGADKIHEMPAAPDLPTKLRPTRATLW